MIRKILIAIGLSLGLSVPLSFVAQPASAASSDVIAQALVGATLQNLGLDELSDDLSQELAGQLTDAIDAGVIDPAISAQVARLLENPAMMAGLSDVFDAHLNGETSSWKTWALLKPDSNPVRGGDDASDSNGPRDSNDSGEGSDDRGLSNSGDSGNDGESEDSGSSGGEDSNDSGRDEPSDSGGSSDDDNDDEDEKDPKDEDEDDSEFEDDSVDERRRPVQ